MATEQAWADFNYLKSELSFIPGVVSNSVKLEIKRLEDGVAEILADPARTAAAAALADQHPVYTSAYLLDAFNRLVALKAAIIANGF